VGYDDPVHEFFFGSKREVLTELLRRQVGPDARLELRCVAESVRAAPRETDRARHSKREAMEHPLVREAAEIFDADVEEVRILKP
jgi:hypothetical protein